MTRIKIRTMQEISQMKTLSLVSLTALSGAGLLLFTGCASFQHQTGKTEPHALVIVTKDAHNLEEPNVIKIDGLSVRPEREYRVKPGKHEIIILEMVPFDKTYGQEPQNSFQPNPTLTLSPTEAPDLNTTRSFSGSSYGQPLNIRVKSWNSYYTTNAILVEPGWRYVLDGWEVRKTRFSNFTPGKADDVREINPVSSSSDPEDVSPVQPVAPPAISSDMHPDLDDPKVVAELFAKAEPFYSLFQRPQANGEAVYFFQGQNTPYTGWTQETRTEFSKSRVSILLSWKKGRMHGPYGKWYANGQKA